MKLKEFIRSFFKSKGGWVFASVLITKTASFFVTYFAINLLVKDEFGEIAYANSIVGFVIPLMGLGAFQGLLRYGTKFKNIDDKLTLFKYSLQKGLLFSFLIVVLLFIAEPLVTSNMPGSGFFFRILVFQIIGLTLFEFIKSYFRLIHKNQLYAVWEVVYSVLLLAVSLLLIKLYGGAGYVFAIVVTPFAVSLYLMFRYGLLPSGKVGLDKTINKKKFWKYGLIVSLGAVSSQFLYSIDIVMLGNILQDSGSVAVYRAAGLIPLSLRFLPAVFIATDYVKFAENETNTTYLKHYYINYLKLFIPFSVALVLFFYFTSGLWGVFFGSGYEKAGELSWIFALSISAGFIFRIPLGNILTATSWAHYISYITIATLAINTLLNFFFIKTFGVQGAAWASAASMWLAAISSFLVFRLYIKKY